MAEPARKRDPEKTAPGKIYQEEDSEGRPIPEWEIKLGKMIFYITCALALWFFYWLNGIQCPC